MSKWATLYRPTKFKEVVGQDHVKQVLIPLLQQGKAAQRSYIFAGPSGTGKTTLARIVAMSLLCETPLADREDGVEPCGHCVSCQQIQSTGSHLGYTELDAANQGGKATIQEIVAGTAYATLGPSDRKLYCMDECHRLSSDAMDALLKPLEDEIPGTGGDKRLLILFCTTELEKIRPALRARCLTFKLTSPKTEALVSRLGYLLDQEGVAYDKDALPLIVASGKGHVRDMVSHLEQVAQAGAVTLQAVRTLLDLDVEDVILKMLETFLTQEQDLEAFVEKVLERVSPKQAYALTVSVLMQIWRNKSVYLDEALLGRLNMSFASLCLNFTSHLLKSPYLVTPEHYLCDMCFLKAYYLKQASSLAPTTLPSSSDKSTAPRDLPSAEYILQVVAAHFGGQEVPAQKDSPKPPLSSKSSALGIQGAGYDIEKEMVPTAQVNPRKRVAIRSNDDNPLKSAETLAAQKTLDQLKKGGRR